MKSILSGVIAAICLTGLGSASADPVTAIVTFPLQKGMTTDQARDLYLASAPTYQAAPGLIRKYYLFDEAASSGGGVYLWETQEDADAVYTPEWRASLEQRLGAAPEIKFYVSPVIVDNVTGEVEAGSGATN